MRRVNTALHGRGGHQPRRPPLVDDQGTFFGWILSDLRLLRFVFVIVYNRAWPTKAVEPARQKQRHLPCDYHIN